MKTEENTFEGKQIKFQEVLAKWNFLFVTPVENTTSLKGLQIWFCHIKYSKFVSKLSLIISHWIPENLTKHTMQTTQSHLYLCQTGKMDINVMLHFMLFLKVFSKADFSLVSFTSARSTLFYCTIYEMNPIAPIRSGSSEENKLCSLAENEDSTFLLQFPSWLNGTVRWLICPSCNHRTVLQTVKNRAEWVKFQLRNHCSPLSQRILLFQTQSNEAAHRAHCGTDPPLHHYFSGLKFKPGRWSILPQKMDWKYLHSLEQFKIWILPRSISVFFFLHHIIFLLATAGRGISLHKVDQ